jgi:hypothetical protein
LKGEPGKRKKPPEAIPEEKRPGRKNRETGSEKRGKVERQEKFHSPAA